jgi:hypothetical protein
MANELSFKASDEERALVRKIVKRARSLGWERRTDDCVMDLIACHANGNPMDFAKLLAADDFNLMHDVAGIARHMDFQTGKLLGHFSPRCSAREVAAA